MSNDPPATPPAELQIKPRASDWAKQKLAAERAEAEPGPDAIKQVALRIPIEDIELVGAIAKRFGISRNQMLCMLISSACADVYAELPGEERREIVEQVGESLGRPVQVRWVREIDFTDEEDALIPDHIKQAMRYEP